MVANKLYSLHGVYKVRSLNLQICNLFKRVARYVLDIGLSEDWLALQISMAPCLIGYGVIANRLHDDPNTKREGNIYWTWIKNYVAEDYSEAVKVGTGTKQLIPQKNAQLMFKRIN